MKTRKELSQILSNAIEEKDTDALWWVVGELRKGEEE